MLIIEIAAGLVLAYVSFWVILALIATFMHCVQEWPILTVFSCLIVICVIAGLAG